MFSEESGSVRPSRKTTVEKDREVQWYEQFAAAGFRSVARFSFKCIRLWAMCACVYIYIYTWSTHTHKFYGHLKLLGPKALLRKAFVPFGSLDGKKI